MPYEKKLKMIRDINRIEFERELSIYCHGNVYDERVDIRFNKAIKKYRSQGGKV
jgi:hypothetical protein